LLGVPAVVGAACGSDADGSSPAGGKPFDGEVTDVVASTPIVAEWVARVGGERVAVTALVPSGADAHTLELSPDGIRAIVEAELIVLNGAGLENAYLGTVEANAEGAVLTLSAGLELWEEEQGRNVDPHFWLDPTLAVEAIGLIRETLAELFPNAAEWYAANAAAYVAEIEAADHEASATLAALAADQRVLVTFHDAYAYFARHHELEILGFVVEGPEQEPSASRLADLVTEMQERGITVVYHEPQFDSGVVRRVADETGAEVRTIYSQPFGAVATYTDVLRANARALAE